MNNIIMFKVLTAKVIENCYQTFPVTTAISCRDISQNVQKSMLKDSDDFELTILTTNAINWLKEEGYLRVGSQELNDFFDVTITNKLFVILSSFEKGTHVTIAEKLKSGNIKELCITMDAVFRLGK